MLRKTNISLETAPVGVIKAFGADTAPTGWLLCNAGEYSKTDPLYKNLYSVIGTAFGETNGSGGGGTSHFRVPDYRDKFPKGKAASGEAVGATGGSNSTTLNNTQLPEHNHSITHTHTVPKFNSNSVSKGTGGSGYEGSAWHPVISSPSVFATPDGLDPWTNSSTTNSQNTTNSGSVGSGSSIENRPAFQAVNYIIKY
jgi:microcystin-dependent protein